VSYSFVRTCDRCGVRAERPLSGPFSTREACLRSFAIVRGLLDRADRADRRDWGCPSCDPEGAKAAGIDLDAWQRDVERALRRPV
jgi:hypothetical protein